MSFYSILGFSLLATVLLILIRKERPEIGIMLSIAAASVIFIALLPNLNRVLLVFESLGIKSNQNLEYLKLIIKIIGLAYLAGFGAQICKDAGENSMAGKIELAGKIFILTMGMPIMVGLLDLILKIL